MDRRPNGLIRDKNPVPVDVCACDFFLTFCRLTFVHLKNDFQPFVPELTFGHEAYNLRTPIIHNHVKSPTRNGDRIYLTERVYLLGQITSPFSSFLHLPTIDWLWFDFLCSCYVKIWKIWITACNLN